MAKNPEAIRKFLAEHEDPNDTRTCSVCEVTKSLSDFGITTQFHEKYNKAFIGRRSRCMQCARSEEYASRSAKTKKRFLDKAVDEAAFLAAARVIASEPKAVALLIKYFKPQFEIAYNEEIGKIETAYNQKIELLRKANYAKNPHRAKSNNPPNKLERLSDENTKYIYIKEKGPRKLSPAKVAELRHLYEIDGVTIADLAKKYEVAESTISDVILKKRWKGVS